MEEERQPQEERAECLTRRPAAATECSCYRLRQGNEWIPGLPTPSPHIRRGQHSFRASSARSARPAVAAGIQRSLRTSRIKFSLTGYSALSPSVQHQLRASSAFFSGCPALLLGIQRFLQASSDLSECPARAAIVQRSLRASSAPGV
jgi:hypothetical protein